MESGGQDTGDVNGNGHDSEPLNPTAAATALAERTLTGDLRDYILDLVREQRNPWALLTELQQSNLAAEIEAECETLVRRAVAIIAARDFTAIGVSLEEVSFKPKGVAARMTFGAMDVKTRHALVDSQGGRVVIVAADPDIFRGSRGLARIDKQQPDLPIAWNDMPAQDAPADGGDAPADAAPFDLGYDDVRCGRQMQFCPFQGGSDERARYQAGRYQAQLDGMKDSGDHKGATKNVAAHFRAIGKAAAKAGAQPTDNPFAKWMPARKAWNEGFFAEAGTDADTQPPAARRRGRPRKEPPEPPGA